MSCMSPLYIDDMDVAKIILLKTCTMVIFHSKVYMGYSIKMLVYVEKYTCIYKQHVHLNSDNDLN